MTTVEEWARNYRAYIESKPLNFIRHLPFEEYPYNLCVQLPMHSTENMREIAAPLIDEIGGEKGLLYTAWFEWEKYDRVREFFDNLGYTIYDVDKRGSDRRIKELSNE